VVFTHESRDTNSWGCHSKQWVTKKGSWKKNGLLGIGQGKQHPGTPKKKVSQMVVFQ
jgi:hypothetical protein